MGRSEQKQVQQQGNTLLGNENATTAETKNLLMPALSSELQNPGYTDAQKTAITGATEGGIGAAFGSAEEGAANRAARTNNAAGLTSTQDALARQRMITSGNLGAANEGRFADTALQQKQQAIGGLGAMYGQNLSGANNTLGTLAGNAKTPSFWDQLAMAGMNAGGQAAAAGAGA